MGSLDFISENWVDLRIVEFSPLEFICDKNGHFEFIYNRFDEIPDHLKVVIYSHKIDDDNNIIEIKFKNKEDAIQRILNRLKVKES